MSKPSRVVTKVELARLRELLEYKPRKGIFVWKPRSGYRARTNLNGKTAGTIDLKGYVLIGVNGRHYRAHQLAWLFIKGKWPTEPLDHKDGVRSNNKWTNIRPVTNGQNNWNTRKLYKSNTSGKRGVSWETFRQAWIARVTVDGHQINLGVFPKNKLKEAIAARKAGELKYFGEYAPK